ncbi:MAG: hypothetical protein V1944_01695 [Candidatus Aenigmatarchaeota archaeon]
MDFGPIQEEVRYQDRIRDGEDHLPLLERIEAKSWKAAFGYHSYSPRHQCGNGQISLGVYVFGVGKFCMAIPYYTVRETVVSITRRL